MTMSLADMQQWVREPKNLRTLDDFRAICSQFLTFLADERPTRIVSPTATHYIFFQFDQSQQFRITRPLNSTLFIEAPAAFAGAYERFVGFLTELRTLQADAARLPRYDAYLASGELNKVVYTLQQAIGAISDSFENANQARKRVGQSFEALIRLIIVEAGIVCASRTIHIPIPGFPGYVMPYELDVVFSRVELDATAEHYYIHPSEVVGSIKTTSKDRLDKIFLDKYLLAHLLGKPIPVIAIFLHDVQRATIPGQADGGAFAIRSTFKRNHFLGYTVALTRLDGVYYVDPRPEMRANQLLSSQIHDFQQLLAIDLWSLLAASNGEKPSSQAPASDSDI